MAVEIASMLLIVVFCAAPAMASDSLFAEKEILRYPFAAEADRAASLRRHYPSVVIGMSAAEVKSLLGEPDEVRRLYAAAHKRSPHIGYTFGFVIQRAAGHGSADDRQEVLVRVSFDLDGRVTKVDHWGLDADSE